MEAGPVAVGARRPVVDVDPDIADARSGQRVSRRGEILLFCGHPRVAHQGLVHHPGRPSDKSLVNGQAQHRPSCSHEGRLAVCSRGAARTGGRRVRRGEPSTASGQNLVACAQEPATSSRRTTALRWVGLVISVKPAARNVGSSPGCNSSLRTSVVVMG